MKTSFFVLPPPSLSHLRLPDYSPQSIYHTHLAIMSLLGLPAELLRQTVVHAVTVQDLRLSLRLRLVNREAATLCTQMRDHNLPTDHMTGLFAGEVTQALYESDTLNEHVKGNVIEAGLGPEHDQSWQQYLTNKIFLRRIVLSEREFQLRRVAERLCEANNYHHHECLRTYVHALCYQPHRVLQRNKAQQLQPWDESRHLVQAAIINDCTEVIRGMSKCDDFFGVFGGHHDRKVTEMWTRSGARTTSSPVQPDGAIPARLRSST